ncbi:unnamed protein product [Lymnaea stagnalis]|uniref:CARD domain-containing protein n=1 Tax=Lymnaea stagnalis TaxID=6523 RepID=A0AAV2H5T9_LYMST
MDKAHKEIIQKNFMKLVDEISTQVEQVTSLLLNEHQIITKRMWEDVVQANNTLSRKADALLTLLLTRGPHAFNALYEAVKTAELNGAADILMPQNAPHWKKPDVDS